MKINSCNVNAISLNFNPRTNKPINFKGQDEFIKSDMKMIDRFSRDIDNLYGITAALTQRVEETNNFYTI